MNQDQIWLYAADALESAESAAVAGHLRAGCPICAGRLAEAESLLAMLADSVEPARANEALFQRILKRVRVGDTTAIRVVPVRHNEPANSRRTLGRMVMIGLSSAAAAAAITFAIVWQSASPARQMLGSESLQVVALAGSNPQTRARGRVLWDQQNHQWQVKVFDLAPPPPGKTFELWFITTDQQKIRATTFQTDSDGTATLTVAVPKDIAPLAMAAITDEPAGGVSQPTGTIQLAGKIRAGSPHL